MCQTIPCWGMDIKTNTKWRSLDWTPDSTKFYIYARTCYLSFVDSLQSIRIICCYSIIVSTSITCRIKIQSSGNVIVDILIVVCSAAVVNTLCTNGKTEEPSVIDVSADIEVELADVSFAVIHTKELSTIRHVLNTLNIIVVIHQVIHVV